MWILSSPCQFDLHETLLHQSSPLVKSHVTVWAPTHLSSQCQEHWAWMIKVCGAVHTSPPSRSFSPGNSGVLLTHQSLFVRWSFCHIFVHVFIHFFLLFTNPSVLMSPHPLPLFSGSHNWESCNLSISPQPWSTVYVCMLVFSSCHCDWCASCVGGPVRSFWRSVGVKHLTLRQTQKTLNCILKDEISKHKMYQSISVFLTSLPCLRLWAIGLTYNAHTSLYTSNTCY